MRRPKIAGILLVFTLALLFATCSTFAASEDSKAIHSGKSGDLEWSIKENGEFILEGEGSLADAETGSFCFDKNGNEFFIFGTKKPWLKYSDKIVHAKIRVQNPKSLAGILYNCKNLETVDFTGSDTSETIDFATMIATDYVWGGEPNKVKHLDLSMLDTSSAVRMTQLLWGCTNLETVDVSGWDTSNVTELGSAFDCCLKLKTVKGIEKWDTSNVTEMYTMFQSCEKLKKLDLSKWNTGKLVSVYSMFSNCKSLETLDVSTWDVSNIYDFSRMFYRNTKLKKMDLTKWNMKNATSVESMFGWCYKLYGGITFNSKITSYDNAFTAASTQTKNLFVINYKGKCGRSLANKICKTNDYSNSNVVLGKCSEGHKLSVRKAIASTCKKVGKTAGTYCPTCKTSVKKQKTLQKKNHSFNKNYTVDKPATAKKNGSKSQHCKNCNAKRNTKVIYKLKTVKLSKKNFTYDGNVKTPKVIVKDSKGNTVAAKNYTVTKAKGRTEVGTYTYKVTFKNAYKGTKARLLSFTIQP